MPCSCRRGDHCEARLESCQLALECLDPNHNDRSQPCLARCGSFPLRERRVMRPKMLCRWIQASSSWTQRRSLARLSDWRALEQPWMRFPWGRMWCTLFVEKPVNFCARCRWKGRANLPGRGRCCH